MEAYNDVIIQQTNDDIKKTEELEEHECFICFEIKKEEQMSIQLKNQTIFLKFCKCDGWIHDSCLKTWFTANEKCPICRNIMLENNTFDLEYGFYIFLYYYLMKKFLYNLFQSIIRFRNIFMFCFIVSNIIHIVFIAYDKNYQYIYNYEYTNEYCPPSEYHYNEPIENRIIPIVD